MGKMFLVLFFFSTSVGYTQQLDTVKIFYDEDVTQQLASSAKKALLQGVITKDLKRNQYAKIQFDSLKLTCKIRLKGDWTDHVKNDKWSFRVKLDSGNIYKTRKFSLQFPETRGGINESIFHEVLLAEGILTTSYKFVHLSVNDEYWGIFAFEEQPDELLLENNNKSKGPILKFDEDGFWECQLQSLNEREAKCVEYSIFESAKVKPFNKKKTFSDSVGLNKFLTARSCLEKWQSGTVNFDNLDLNKFAKYYALCDLFGMYHGLQWHNQRFYFRTKDNKIEPLAYDCYSKDNKLIGKKFLGYFDEHYKTIYFKEQWFNYQLFTSEKFRELYIQSLNKYIEKKWNFSAFSDFEFAENHFDIEKRIENRKKEIAILISSEHLNPVYYGYSEWKKDHPEEIKKYKTPYSETPLKHVAIRARQVDDRIEVKNYHLHPLEILGFGTKSYFSVPIPKTRISPNEILHFTKDFANHIYYRTELGDTLKYEIEKADQVLDKCDTLNLNNFQIKANYYLIIDQKISINGLIIIPEKCTLEIDNSTLDFIEGGRIISYGEVTIRTSSLTSSDGRGKGVFVLNSNLTIEESVISNFDLSSYSLNCPVICDGGKVHLSKLKVHDINSEDAIDLINSSFFIEDVKVENCDGNGIDIDFSEGKITNTVIKKCLGDGINFSGSIGILEKVVVLSCEDKGVSIGERSTIRLMETQISDCSTGIAIKDESTAYLDDNEIKNCTLTIHGFKEKKHYNFGAIIYLDNKYKYNVLLDTTSKCF